jgi:hypothetical protein
MRKLKLRTVYVVVFFLISFVVYFVTTKVFTIREIRVVGDTIQVSVDEKKLPRTLLFFPADKIRAEILHDNPILADLRFEKQYPNTLVIVPTLRAKAALIITPTRRVFVDERGIVLTDADTSPLGLPQIAVNLSGLGIGKTIDDTRVRASLAFLSGIQATVPMETVTISDDGVITAHTGNLDILFTQHGDIPTILTTLQTLLTGFRIKGTLPSVIDLRFDKPVVTF